MDFACRGFSAFQIESSGASLYECSAALRERRAAVLAVSAGDAANVDIACDCCDFRAASAQCGVRGLGRGAQERAQHVVSLARALGLPALRIGAKPCQICRGLSSVRLRIDDEAASHHASLPAFALGLLAAATIAI